jgi:hypothetical protein
MIAGSFHEFRAGRIRRRLIHRHYKKNFGEPPRGGRRALSGGDCPRHQRVWDRGPLRQRPRGRDARQQAAHLPARVGREPQHARQRPAHRTSALKSSGRPTPTGRSRARGFGGARGRPSGAARSTPSGTSKEPSSTGARRKRCSRRPARPPRPRPCPRRSRRASFYCATPPGSWTSSTMTSRPLKRCIRARQDRGLAAESAQRPPRGGPVRRQPCGFSRPRLPRLLQVGGREGEVRRRRA